MVFHWSNFSLHSDKGTTRHSGAVDAPAHRLLFSIWKSPTPRDERVQNGEEEAGHEEEGHEEEGHS